MKVTTWRRQCVCASFAAGACALLLIAGWAVSELDAPRGLTPAKETAGPQGRDVAVRVGAAQVAVEPGTARLRALTKTEASELAAEMQHFFDSGPASRLTHHDDGRLSAVVGAVGCKLSVVTKNDDGIFTTACAGIGAFE